MQVAHHDPGGHTPSGWWLVPLIFYVVLAAILTGAGAIWLS